MRENTEYNGWTNWETWVMNLWLQNDELTQRFVECQVSEKIKLYGEEKATEGLIYAFPELIKDTCKKPLKELIDHRDFEKKKLASLYQIPSFHRSKAFKLMWSLSAEFILGIFTEFTKDKGDFIKSFERVNWREIIGFHVEEYNRNLLCEEEE